MRPVGRVAELGALGLLDDMRQAEQSIRQALREVGILMEHAFAEVGGVPVPNSALDQAGRLRAMGIRQQA